MRKSQSRKPPLKHELLVIKWKGEEGVALNGRLVYFVPGEARQADKPRDVAARIAAALKGRVMPSIKIRGRSYWTWTDVQACLIGLLTAEGARNLTGIDPSAYAMEPPKSPRKKGYA